MKKKWLCVVALFVYCTCDLSAQTQRFFEIRESAMKGDALAQFYMGVIYDGGYEDVQRDESEAFNWYVKSANGGCPEGQYNLGCYYLYGTGTPQDEKAAFYWIEKSAKNGLKEGEGMLGYLYSKGKGTSVNYDQSFYWYNKSAKQGAVYAYDGLAWCYMDGRGVQINYKLAHDWINKAIIAEPNNTTYYETKGLIYAKQGDKANAMLMWLKVLDINPSFIADQIEHYGNLVDLEFYNKYIKNWVDEIEIK